MKLADDISAFHSQIQLTLHNQHSPYPLRPYHQMQKTVMSCRRPLKCPLLVRPYVLSMWIVICHCYSLSEIKQKLCLLDYLQIAINLFHSVHNQFDVTEIFICRIVEHNITHHCQSKTISFIFHIEDI